MIIYFRNPLLLFQAGYDHQYNIKLTNIFLFKFLKESNLYLEAERSLYVSSLRDLEEKLRVASLEARCQQQVAADAEKLVMQLEHEKLDLV